MLVTIGKAIKTFGVKGEMKIEPLTDFPERFRELHRVYLVSPAGKEIVCEVRSSRNAGGATYLLFAGYDTPEKAKVLNGWFLKIPEEETVPLPDGSYYWFELIGMEVVSESGEKLGAIVDIFQTGSNDVYVLKKGGKEVYIPATKEVIRQVDKKARRMTIRVLEGLLE
jgi:16S rRNA processing protein RimM